MNHRHEDFRAASITPEIGTHIHRTTSDDVVTLLAAVEQCR